MHADLEPSATVTQLLRELPDRSVPYDFAEFERRARTRAGRHLAGGPFIAATAVIAVSVLALCMRLSGPAGSIAIAPPEREPEVRAVNDAGGEAAMRSQQMENWLASLPDEPALVQVGTHSAVTGLEDRIAQVDDLLNAARVAHSQVPGVAALQQERTRLVGALVQVRYAETLADPTR